MISTYQGLIILNLVPVYSSYSTVYCINLYIYILQDGYTALIWASARGHTNVVQALLAAGANTDAVNYVSYISI